MRGRINRFHPALHADLRFQAEPVRELVERAGRIEAVQIGRIHLTRDIQGSIYFRDHGRQADAIAAIPAPEKLNVSDAHHHILPGCKIAHAAGEVVGCVLIQEISAVVVCQRLIVSVEGGVPFHYPGYQFPLRVRDLESADSGVHWQGKAIHSLDRDAFGVHVVLFDGCLAGVVDHFDPGGDAAQGYLGFTFAG